MPITWTTTRRVVVAISAMSAVLGLVALAAGWRAWRDFRAWETAVPLAGPVDLSSTAVFELPFTHSCAVSHATEFWIELPAGADARALLSTAAARLEILAPNNDTSALAVSEFDRDPLLDASRPSQALLFRFSGLPRGKYLAKVTLTRAARALTGIPQYLRADYLLCGLEAMPALVLFASAAAAWIAAALLTALGFHFSRPAGKPPTAERA